MKLHLHAVTSAVHTHTHTHITHTKPSPSYTVYLHCNLHCTRRTVQYGMLQDIPYKSAVYYYSHAAQYYTPLAHHTHTLHTPSTTHNAQYYTPHTHHTHTTHTRHHTQRTILHSNSVLCGIKSCSVSLRHRNFASCCQAFK